MGAGRFSFTGGDCGGVARGGVGGIAGCSCGGEKPKNKFGISSGMGTVCCGLAIFIAPLCLARKCGTTAFSGNSNSIVSCADVAGGVGLIHERRFSQVNVTRPRFRADSIKFTGNATWAFAEINEAISDRSASGHFPESAASGTRVVACADTTGVGVGVGIGIGATGTTVAAGRGGVMG